MSGGIQSAAGQVALSGGLSAFAGAMLWWGVAGREKWPEYQALAESGRWRWLLAFNTGFKLTAKFFLLPAGLLAAAVGLIWMAAG